MSTSEVAGGAAQPSVAELLMRIEELSRRVEWLEAGQSNGPAASTAIPPDVVLAISAAVAAYLGERARVRQIRLADSTTWSQQGRASIMGSHSVPHGPTRGTMTHRSYR